MSSILKKAAIGLVVILALFGYLQFSHPGKLVVNSHGEIAGLQNQIREQLQGPGFWTNQMEELGLSLERLDAQIVRHRDRMAKVAEADLKIKLRMSEHYSKYPNLRPSPATMQAEALRDSADQIEQDEIDQAVVQAQSKRAFGLLEIVPVIKLKINNSQ